jgi:hypothetical protein
MALKAHVCPTLRRILLLVYIGGCISMGKFSKGKWKKRYYTHEMKCPCKI